MDRKVLLKLAGTLQQGLEVTLELPRGDHSIAREEVSGQLPPDPTLAKLLKDFLHKYRDSGDLTWRLKPLPVDNSDDANSTTEQLHKSCREAWISLRDRFVNWLQSDSFRPIDLRLREYYWQNLQDDEYLRILLRTPDDEFFQLIQLPWDEWEFCQNNKAQVVPLNSIQPLRKLLSNTSSKPRILVILGHGDDIDVQTDRKLLEQYGDVRLLVEPERRELGDNLWDQPWDMIFFSGHSHTEGDTGRIYLNSHDHLTIDELWLHLRKAVNRGLKLAVFNSCDGLGIVKGLNDDVHIPHVVVMREAIPDFVAHEFLKYLLKALADNLPVNLAVREAQQRLEILENKFPCARWLPVIFQNVDYVPISLAQPQPLCTQRLRTGRWQFKQGVLISLAVTTLVMGLRWTGLLQSAELQAYDHLMRQRPAEPIDPRIVVVEVTQADINQAGGYPLKDDQLAQLIAKIAEAKPKAIGLSMHRYQPRGQGRQTLMHQFRNPALIITCSYGSDAIDYGQPPPELSAQQKVKQVGFSDSLVDDSLLSSNVIRRQLIAYNPELLDKPSACTTPFSFGWQLTQRFLATSGRALLQHDGLGWRGEQFRYQPLASRAGGYQQLDGKSQQILMNYRAMPKPGRRMSMAEVLRGEQLELMRDRLVLIGHSDHEDAGTYQTPIGELADVWIDAHFISQILSTELDGRPLIWLLPQWTWFQWGDAVFVWVWALWGWTIVWVGRSPWFLAGLTAIGLIVLYHICLAVLIYGGWMPLIPATIAILLGSSLGAYGRYRLSHKP